jgi:ABC-type Mn2+/Zn2+ transport system ATPase subunit
MSPVKVANGSVQGLDSQGAYSILLLLRRLADAGQSILCTIHQANHQQFTLVFHSTHVSPNLTNMCSLIMFWP